MVLITEAHIDDYAIRRPITSHSRLGGSSSMPALGRASSSRARPSSSGLPHDIELRCRMYGESVGIQDALTPEYMNVIRHSELNIFLGGSTSTNTSSRGTNAMLASSRQPSAPPSPEALAASQRFGAGGQRSSRDTRSMLVPIDGSGTAAAASYKPLLNKPLRVDYRRALTAAALKHSQGQRHSALRQVPGACLSHSSGGGATTRGAAAALAAKHKTQTLVERGADEFDARQRVLGQRTLQMQEARRRAPGTPEAELGFRHMHQTISWKFVSRITQPPWHHPASSRKPVAPRYSPTPSAPHNRARQPHGSPAILRRPSTLRRVCARARVRMCVCARMRVCACVCATCPTFDAPAADWLCESNLTLSEPIASATRR